MSSNESEHDRSKEMLTKTIQKNLFNANLLSTRWVPSRLVALSAKSSSMVEQKSSEKSPRVEDSLNDLSKVQWRTEFNGKRLWPHDQWPERDLVNYPPYQVKESPNAVRWYFVPESWFKFFYDKTGVTGPYMFFYGLLIYGFSKEHIVLWYDFTEYLILAAAVVTVVKKVGPTVGDVFRGWYQDDVSRYNSIVQTSKALAGKSLHSYEESLERARNVSLLVDARKELLQMGLEAAYRERMKQVYESVKRRLDYQVALQNARKDFERSNMINWITSEVRKSISAKQEQDTLQSCLQQLRQIASSPSTR